MLAKTPSDMESIVEMLPKWREMQRSLREIDAELFARAYISSYHILYGVILNFIHAQAAVSN